MCKMQKISVIIPVFNTEPEFIEKALNSVLEQTYKNLEIIIVNDGSTKSNTLNYLKILKQDIIPNNSSIRIIDQENKKAGGARNTGLEIASGDYISFMDADDWLDKNYYETLVDISKKDDCDIACATLYRVTKNSSFPLEKFNNTIVTTFLEKIKYITNGSISSKLFKKNLFNDIKFLDDVYWEDNLILVELLLKSKNVAFTNLVKYYYRENQTSICLNSELKYKQKRKTDGLKVFNHIYNLPGYKSEEERESAIRVFAPIVIDVEYTKAFEYQKACLYLNAKYQKYKKISNALIAVTIIETILILACFALKHFKGVI